jgi:hypothetical protein
MGVKYGQCTLCTYENVTMKLIILYNLYIHRERETDRQRDRETERERQRSFEVTKNLKPGSRPPPSFFHKLCEFIKFGLLFASKKWIILENHPMM